jgi:hypothetical protein
VLYDVFAVAPELSVRALNGGLARGLAGRGVRWRAPDHVLLAYLARRPDVAVIGDLVRCLVPPPVEVLRAPDRELVMALRAAPGGVLSRRELLARYATRGRSPAAGAVLLARSPVLQLAGRGAYAVRGADTSGPRHQPVASNLL